MEKRFKTLLGTKKPIFDIGNAINRQNKMTL